MLPVIITPDVELWATGWLRAALAARSEAYVTGVKVDNKIPTSRPTRLVAVRHDGGPRVNILQTQARLGVNIFSETEQNATDLARLVEGLLLSVVNLPPVDEVTSSSSITRVEEPSPRRYFTVQVLMRGAVK